MYCILVTGIPASGKSTLAAWLSDQLGLPLLSKDGIKELLFDRLGFRSREEKVQLGLAGMDILYYAAEQLMKVGLPFILENNFEHVSRDALLALLERYRCTAITVALTGDYETIYRRFLARDASPQRHPGHVFNDCYPHEGERREPPLSFERFVASIERRGMDAFSANGPRIVVDTTDFERVDLAQLLDRVRGCAEQCCDGRQWRGI